MRTAATGIATALLGDSIATNMFMLGYAYQKGFVPLGHESIERAIELNGAAVPMNLAAFRWGRRTAFDRASVDKAMTGIDTRPPTTLGNAPSIPATQIITRAPTSASCKASARR